MLYYYIASAARQAETSARWASGSMSDSEFDDDQVQGPVHPLYGAIANGDLNEVKRRIVGLPVDCTHLVSDCGSSGYTPLERACYSGRVDIVKFLIGEGADVNRRGHESSYTPLHKALMSPHTTHHIACVKVLLAAGADVNARALIFTEMLPLELVIVTSCNHSDSSDSVPHICRRLCSVLLHAGATIPDQDIYLNCFKDDSIHPYLQKIVNAGDFKAYAKTHRQKLVTMFVRTRCFQRVPDEIVPLIVDYGFHVGFY